MEQILQVFFNAAIFERAWPFLARGVGMTVLLSLVIVPIGLASGLAVAMLYHLRRKWLNRLLMAYVDFFRAFPPLVLLLFIYGGLPFLGVDLPLFGTDRMPAQKISSANAASTSDSASQVAVNALIAKLTYGNAKNSTMITTSGGSARSASAKTTIRKLAGLNWKARTMAKERPAPRPAAITAAARYVVTHMP